MDVVTDGLALLRAGEAPVLVYPSSPHADEPVHLLARSIADESAAANDSSSSLGLLCDSGADVKGLCTVKNGLVSWDREGLTVRPRALSLVQKTMI